MKRWMIVVRKSWGPRWSLSYFSASPRFFPWHWLAIIAGIILVACTPDAVGFEVYREEKVPPEQKAL